jgi:hypothetical protein
MNLFLLYCVLTKDLVPKRFAGLLFPRGERLAKDN